MIQKKHFTECQHRVNVGHMWIIFSCFSWVLSYSYWSDDFKDLTSTECDFPHFLALKNQAFLGPSEQLEHWMSPRMLRCYSQSEGFYLQSWPPTVTELGPSTFQCSWLAQLFPALDCSLPQEAASRPLWHPEELLFRLSKGFLYFQVLWFRLRSPRSLLMLLSCRGVALLPPPAVVAAIISGHRY